MDTYADRGLSHRLSAMALTLRKPQQGDFGYPELVDEILYFDQCFLDQKDLTWFMGTEEYRAQSVWAELETDEKLLIHVGATIKDGSYPIDDLDVEMVNLSTYGTNKNSTDKVGRLRFMTAFRELDSQVCEFTSPIIPTKRLTPESFVKALQDRLQIHNLDTFQRVFDYYVDSQVEEVNIYSERPFVKELYLKVFGTKKSIRSAKEQQQAKIDIFNELIINSAEGYFSIDTVANFTNSEVIEIAEKVGSMPMLFDPRALIEMSLEADFKKEVKAKDKLYIGRLDETTNKLPSRMILVPKNQDGTVVQESMTIEFKFSFNFKNFSATVTGPVESVSAPKAYSTTKKTINISKAKIYMDRLSKKYPQYCGLVPGYINNMPSDLLPELLSSVRLIMSDYAVYTTYAFYSADKEVMPWIDKITAKVKCDADIDIENIRFTPDFQGDLNYTKKDISDLALQTSITYQGPPTTTIELPKPGLDREAMASITARGLETLYRHMEEPLKFTLRVVLGAYEVERPYMVLSKTSVDGPPNFPVDLVTRPKPPEIKKDKNVTVTVPMLIACTKLWMKHGDKALGIARKLINQKSKGTPSSFFQPPSVGGNKKGALSYSNPIEPEVKGMKDSDVMVYFDPSAIAKHHVLAHLVEIAMHEIIENDTLISFSTQARSKIARPRDYALSVLSSAQYNYVKLARSIYAQEDSPQHSGLAGQGTDTDYPF